MTDPFSGVEYKALIKLETAFDTPLAFAASDGVAPVELSIQPAEDRHRKKEHTGTQSLQDWIRGRRSGSWSAKFYIAPNAAGTAPDTDPIITAAMNAPTIVGGTSVEYGLRAAGVAPNSLQIAKVVDDTFVEQINGAWIEQLEIETPEDGSPPMLAVSGGFATYAWCRSGATTDAAGYLAGVSTVGLASDVIGHLLPNAVVAFGAEDNGGTGYRITSLDYTAETCTFTPVLANPLPASAQAITPVYPDPTISGTNLGSVACGFTVDGVDLGLMSAKVTLETGVMGLNKECTTDRPNRLSKTERVVTGEFKVYSLEENAHYIGTAWEGVVRAVTHRIGPDIAANRLTISLPACRFNVTPIEVPEQEAAMATITFECRQSAVADDEMTLMFD